MFAAPGWAGPLIGVSLLRMIVPELFSSADVLAEAIFRGLEIIGYFQTERVIQYLSLFDQIVREILKKESARVCLLPALATCVSIAWGHFEEQSPRFVPLMSQFICRFMRCPEFHPFDSLILAPFFDLFMRNRKRGSDFGSKFVLSFPHSFEQTIGCRYIRSLFQALSRQTRRKNGNRRPQN
jgi:hypothetical protein